MEVRLTGISGRVQGQQFEVKDPVVLIGREASCQIKLTTDSQVSGRHCELFEQDGKLYVRDLDSLNGTLVDGSRINKQNSPAILRSGSRLQIGEDGPEFTVEVIRGDAVHNTVARTLPARQPAAAAPQKTPVVVNSSTTPGMQTIERHISVAVGAIEAKQRKTSRYAAVAFVLLIVAAGGAAYYAYDLSRNDLAQSQREQRVTINEIKKQVAVVSEETRLLADRVASNEKEFRDGIAALGTEMNKKDSQIASLEARLAQVAEADSEERGKLKTAIQHGKNALAEVEKSLAAFEDRNKAMFDKLQAPFKDVAARASNCVYSVFYRKGEQYTFMATAFAIHPTKGLLGTNAHVSKPCEEMLRSGNGQVVVRCNASPRYTYVVRRAFSHPGYSNISSPDVGILEVDLSIDGKNEALPAYLHAATDEELDKAIAGTPVVLLGFPGIYNSQYERTDGSTNVAKLIPGTISRTLEFGGSAIDGRSFDWMEHTCYSMGGNSGSPMMNTEAKVVALLNSGHEFKMSGLRVPIGSINNAINVRFLKNLVKTHFGPGIWE